MSNKCVNYNHKEVIDLASKLKVPPVIAAVKIALWQELFDLDVIPTLNDLTNNTNVESITMLDKTFTDTKVSPVTISLDNFDSLDNVSINKNEADYLKDIFDSYSNTYKVTKLDYIPEKNNKVLLTTKEMIEPKDRVENLKSKFRNDFDLDSNIFTFDDIQSKLDSSSFGLSSELNSIRPDIKIELKSVSEIKEDINYNTAAYYNSGNDTVVLIVDRLPKEKSELTKIVLHEIVHANTVHLLENDTKYKNFFKTLKNRIGDLSNYDLTEIERETIKYHLQNEYEFITGVFTELIFQDFLKSIQPIKKEYSNIFAEFVNLLYQLFNRLTGRLDLDAFSQSLNISKGVLEKAKSTSFYELKEKSNMTILHKAKVSDIDQLIERHNKNDLALNIKQLETLEKWKRNIANFEENDKSYPILDLDIEKDIIPQIEKIKFKNNKLKKDLIENWKLEVEILKQNGKKVYTTQRYTIKHPLNSDGNLMSDTELNENGYAYTTDTNGKKHIFVLNRVTDVQKTMFNKTAKKKVESKRTEAEKIKYNEGLAEVGTFGHFILENLSNIIFKEKFVINYVEKADSNDRDVFESQTEYINRIIDSKKDAILKDLDLIVLKEKGEYLHNFDYYREELLRTALGILYTAQKTNYLINKSLPKDKQKDFVMLSEVKIYNKETNTAGTQDLVILYPNGEVGIFDFKFKKGIYDKKEQKVIYKPISSYVRKSWKNQLDVYSKEQTMQFGTESVIQSVIVPICFLLESTEKEDDTGQNYYDLFDDNGKLNLRRTDNNGIIPYEEIYNFSTATESIDTTSKILNESILAESKRITDRYVKETDKSNPDVKKLIEDKNKLLKELENIKVHYQYKALINTISDYVERMINNKVDTTKTSVNDIIVELDKLNSYTESNYNLLKLAQVLLSQVEETKEFLSDREISQLLSSIAATINKLENMNRGLETKRKTFLLTIANNRNIKIDDEAFEKGILNWTDVNDFSLYFSRLSTFNLPHTQIIKRELDELNFVNNNKILNTMEKGMEIYNKYIKWAESKDFSKGNIFEPLINNYYGNSHLVSTYKYDWSKLFFFKPKVRDITPRNVAIDLIRKEAEFSLNKWNELLDIELKDLRGSEYETKKDFLEKKYFIKYDNDNVASLDWNLLNTFLDNEEQSVSLYHIIDILKLNEGSTYFNEKYLEIAKEKPALDMLNYFKSLNKEFKDIYGLKGRTINQTFIPNITKSFAEKVDSNIFGSNLVLAKNTINDYLIKSFIVYEKPDGELQDDGESMYLVNNSDHIRNEYGVRLQIPMRFVEVLPRPSQAYLDSLNIMTTQKSEVAFGNPFKSKDLFKSFMMMYVEAMNYDKSQKLESISLAAKDDLEKAKLIKNTNVTDVKNLDYVDIEEKSNLKSFLETTIKRDVYRINEQSKDFRIPIPVLGENAKISSTKAIKWLSGINAKQILGFNWKSAFGGYIGMQMNATAEATKGLHFNHKQWKDGVSMIGSFDKKMLVLNNVLKIHQDEDTTKKINDLSVFTKMRKTVKDYLKNPTFMNYQMILHHWTDNSFDNHITAAMLLNYGISPDGKVLPLKDLKMMFPDIMTDKDISKYSIYNMLTLNELDDYGNPSDKWRDFIAGIFLESSENIQYKGLGFINLNSIDGADITDTKRDTLIQFRNKVRYVLGSMRGNRVADDKMHYQNFVGLSAMMQYSSWMPAMIAERFRSTRYNNVTDTFDVGRFRAVWTHLTGDITKEDFDTSYFDVIKKFVFGIIDIMTFTKLNIKDKETLNKVLLEKFKLENLGDYKLLLQKYKNVPNADELITKELSERRLEQYKAFAAEALLYIALYILVVSLKSAVDDDDNKSFLKRILLPILEKAKLETGFFFDPNEMSKVITKGKVPALGSVITLLNLTTNTVGETVDMITFTPSDEMRNWAISLSEDTGELELFGTKEDKQGALYYSRKIVPGLNNLLTLLNLQPSKKKEVDSWWEELLFNSDAVTRM